MGGILTGHAIREAVASGDIVIDPWSDDQLQPHSYDVRLGRDVLTYKSGVGVPHDTKRKPETFHRWIDEDGIIIYPNQGYLMATAERISSRRYVPVIDGKSSIGRWFISVHQTAGRGDVGFDGNYTLEVTGQLPEGVCLYPGMLIAQVFFFETSGILDKPYDGNYKGETAVGPVASRAWRQFK